MSPTIELSIDLYRVLEELAIPFRDRSPEAVIWRLVQERAGLAPSEPEQGVVEPRISGDLLASGVLIPNGLILRFSYRGRHAEAVVRDGRIWLSGKAFSSPSAAAIAAAESFGFPGRSLNGWIHGEYEEEGTWHRLLKLRKPGQTRRRPGGSESG